MFHAIDKRNWIDWATQRNGTAVDHLSLGSNLTESIALDVDKAISYSLGPRERHF